MMKLLNKELYLKVHGEVVEEMRTAVHDNVDWEVYTAVTQEFWRSFNTQVWHIYRTIKDLKNKLNY